MYRAIGRVFGLLVALFAFAVEAQTVREVSCPSCVSDTDKENAAVAACIAAHPYPTSTLCRKHSANVGDCSFGPNSPGVGKAAFYDTSSGTWNGSCYVYPIDEVWQVVEPCAASEGQSLSGTVARSGEPSASNPPPQEVCHNQCLYGLSSAVAATGLDGSELWSGTWVGTGQSCPGTPPPSPNENGDTLEGNLNNDATRASDAAESAYSSFLDQLRADSIAQRGAPSGQSPIGSFWAIPSVLLGAVDRSPTNCNLEIDLSGSASLGFLSGAIASTDVCEVQEFSDTFGNWFMWFCAVLWSWAIVMRGGTPE